MRLRIGFDGKLFAFIGVHWTLVAVDVPEQFELAARWLCMAIDGKVVNEKYISGKVFATMT